ncbi:hypothetical protein ABW286_01275 [Erwinia papayae]|uniref:Uncharacterized protein n=1 Tax=Erwinia papayae TaxID=206499 RepID=A0ABV3MWA1_9GAMM
MGGSGFYQQLVNAGIPGITSGVMHDVLNYMYQVLVSGGEISDATVKQLAANIWGLASNQDRLDELSTIAATMAASLNQN